MAVRAKGFIYRSVFFLGWLLSPLTFWNDAFVNIPLAYVLASLFYRRIGVDFLHVVLAFYWLSNALGLLLMFVSAKRIIRDRPSVLREVFILFITIFVYSAMLILLGRFGILKPFK